MKIQDGVGQMEAEYFYVKSVHVPQIPATGILVRIIRGKYTFIKK